MVNIQQNVAVKGKDMLWVDTDHSGPMGTTLCFEIKGSNDAMITIRCKPEVDLQDASPDTPCQRWQDAHEAPSQTIPITVIFGSHRNTKLKICGDNECLVLRQDISEALLDPQNFKTFWINLTDKAVSLGCGVVHAAGCLLSHPVHVPAQRLFVGFFSLDCPVVFRSIRLARPLRAPSALLPAAPDTLTRRCLDILSQNLAPTNVCEILCTLTNMWRTSELLWGRCVVFLAEHFVAVAEDTPHALCALPVDAVTEALASSRLSAPEISIFFVIESWSLGVPLGPLAVQSPSAGIGPPLRFPPNTGCLKQPLTDVKQVLEHTRFPLMSATHLARVRASPLWRWIGDPQSYLSDSMPLTHAACNAFPTLHPTWAPQPPGCTRMCRPQDLRQMWRHQRRAPPDASAELQFVHTGDKNGALHHLGTNGGTRTRFINPHLTGAVCVVCSSPFCSDSDGSKLTSRVYHGDLCAHANKAGEAFWQLHLIGHSVVCLGYVIRVNDSHAFPRSWLLQGSEDGASWTSLHRVQDSPFFQSKGQYGVWHVEEPLLQPFSRVRLLFVGPTSSVSPVLNVNFIELYGYLTRHNTA